MRVLWSEAALRDYEAIIDFVADQDGLGHAERLHRKLHPAIERLVDAPTRCRVVPELRALGVSDYRELIVRPYRIPFLVRGEEVRIVAVLDGRRELEEVLLRRLTES